MIRSFTFLLLLATASVRAQVAPIHLIPQPVSVKPVAGSMALTKATPITFNTPDGGPVAELLVAKLSVPMGFPLKAKPGKVALPGGIHLILSATPDAKLGAEGYTLNVSPKGATITANKPGGLYYGVQTFLQLLPAAIESQMLVKNTWSIPAVQITDYPRFGWRGLMLDVSRHFFTKDAVKRYIDDMARMKLNVFHWHLTDDEGWRIEIKSLPKLTQVGSWRVPRVGDFGALAPPQPGEAATDGGFYTQDDIREIVQYAQARNVTIVPEIDVPGHSMAAVASYPELSCTRDTSAKVNPGAKTSEWYPNGTFKMLIDNTLDPSDENVYVFLDKVFTEVADLFPGQYIHVGGDECYKGYWANDSSCVALMKQLNMHDVEELQGYFLNRVSQILKAKGKKLLGWDEIMDGRKADEPGATDATVMSWRSVNKGIEAARQGYNVVMTPAPFTYIDYMQGDPTLEPYVYSTLRLKTCYNFEPVPDGVDARLILGGQGNLWTEGVPTLAYAQYMTFPRAWALAEVYWSPQANRNWEGFIPRLETQFERAELAGTNYARSAYDPIIKAVMQEDKLMTVLDTEIPGVDIFYTIDDSVPSQYATKYTVPVEVPEGPVTLRVITYRAGKPIGRLITLKRTELKSRAKTR